MNRINPDDIPDDLSGTLPPELKRKLAEFDLRPIQYILDEQGNPIPAPDLLTWGLWFEDGENRIVARTYVVWKDQRAEVSTIFLAIDHNHGGVGPPILWETMIFGSKLHDYQQRYRSVDAAIKGHREAVALTMEAVANPYRKPRVWKRWCERVGHSRTRVIASDGTTFCPRCGIITKEGRISREIATNFERYERWRPKHFKRTPLAKAINRIIDMLVAEED